MGTDIGAVAPTDKRDESQFLLGASHCNVSAGGPSPSWTCALLILLVMVKEEGELFTSTLYVLSLDIESF